MKSQKREWNRLNTSKAVSIHEIKYGLDAATMKFVKAYATLDRLEGKSHLAIVWQKSKTKKLYEVQEYVLCFKRWGIKDYKVRKIFGLGKHVLHDSGIKEYTELSLLEAAMLIQDAYQQNIINYTKPAANFLANHFILQYDTEAVEKSELLDKLTPRRLSAMMCANVYIAALKRMDRGLLYDMSTLKRQRTLGEREIYMHQEKREFLNYTFLRSRVEDVSRINNGYLMYTSVVLCTQTEEVIKKYYNIAVTTNNNNYLIDDFYEVESTIIPKDDLKNPLNYQVFCTAYYIKDIYKVMNWLDSKKEVFLAGDFNGGTSFKWLQDYDKPWQEFCFTNKIFCEFILTENTFLVFTPKALNLVKIMETVTRELKDAIVMVKKHYLSIRQLYALVFNEARLCDSLEKFRAQTAVVFTSQMPELIEYLCCNAGVICKMNEGVTYYLITKKEDAQIKKVVEYYVGKNKVVVNTFLGDIEKETHRLSRDVEKDLIIYENEWENRNTLFRAAVKDEKKWLIYKTIAKLNHEMPLLGMIGVIPSLKEVIMNFC